jgi:hypothetical protein
VSVSDKSDRSLTSSSYVVSVVSGFEEATGDGWNQGLGANDLDGPLRWLQC